MENLVCLNVSILLNEYANQKDFRCTNGTQQHNWGFSNDAAKRGWMDGWVRWRPDALVIITAVAVTLFNEEMKQHKEGKKGMRARTRDTNGEAKS